MVTLKPSAADLIIGRPLPYSLYDGAGRLLLAKGTPVATEDVRTRLLERGYLTPPDRQTAAPVATSLLVAESLDIFTLSGAPSRLPNPLPAVSHAAVKLLVNGHPQSFAVPFLGAVAGQDITFGTPVVDGAVLSVPPGVRTIAVMSTASGSYSFEAAVKPSVAGQLKITWPQACFTNPLRKHPRVEVGAAVQFRLPHALSLEMPARVINLSRHGALLELNHAPPPLGSVLEVLLQVPPQGSAARLCLLGIVRHAHQHEGLSRLGVEFVGVDGGDQALLNEHLTDLTANHPG